MTRVGGLKERADITDKMQVDILKSLGVRNGEILSAELHQLRTYETIASKMQ